MQRLVDIEKKLAEGKGRGYEHWAKIHNLKQAAKTLNVYQEYGFTSPEQLEAAVDTAYQEMLWTHTQGSPSSNSRQFPSS